MTTFKILHAPVGDSEAQTHDLLGALRQLDPDAAVLVRSTVPRMSPRWRFTLGDASNDGAGRAAILGRRGYRSLLRGSRQIYDHPSAYVNFEVSLIDGRPVAVLGIAPSVIMNATIADQLIDTVETLREDNPDAEVVIGASILALPDSPLMREVFDYLDMLWIRMGDEHWLAWSSGLANVDWTLHFDAVPGQDLPWIEADLRRIG